jgi:hypothetical protein
VLKYYKWGGTILCLSGIALTSFNIYPLNILLSLVGSFLWTVAGYKQKDKPLFLVEFIAVVFYISGILNYIRL